MENINDKSSNDKFNVQITKVYLLRKKEFPVFG
jgi:hypothetical protein